MLVYVYDGSFEGLLTAVFEAFYRKQAPGRLEPEKILQVNLLDEYIHIDTDEEKYQRVYQSIKSKISPEALEWAYHVFLSEEPGAGTDIYKYLRLGWKMGAKVNLHLSDDRVLRVYKTFLRVSHEVHILTGFVRFRLVEGGIYYSDISPDYNVIELLAPHFTKRLADQNWIIHDVKREIAALYNRKEWILTDFTSGEHIQLDGGEAKYQKLWKEFFNTIGIASRVNPRLQKQHMPKRYWKHLTEKS